MKFPKLLTIVASLILSLSMIMPVCVFAEPTDDLNDMDYIPSVDEEQVESNTPVIITNEYGDSFYDGDYNDYDHEEATERTLKIMLPSDLDGCSYTASGGGESTSGILEMGIATFTLPNVSDYNIIVDTEGIEVPEDILTTNIPGATLVDEGDLTISVDLGANWSGAVFSADSALYTYNMSYSVNSDGIMTIRAENDGDFTIYINYDGDEVEPVYIMNDEDGESDEEGTEEIADSSTGKTELGDDLSDGIENKALDDSGSIATIDDADKENENTESSDSSSGGSTVVVIIVIILVAILVAAMVFYYVVRNRTQKQYKQDDSVYDDEDDIDDSNE